MVLLVLGEIPYCIWRAFYIHVYPSKKRGRILTNTTIHLEWHGGFLHLVLKSAQRTASYTRSFKSGSSFILT